MVNVFSVQTTHCLPLTRKNVQYQFVNQIKLLHPMVTVMNVLSSCFQIQLREVACILDVQITKEDSPVSTCSALRITVPLT